MPAVARKVDAEAAARLPLPLKAFAARCGQGIAVLSGDGRVTYANPALLRLVGVQTLRALRGKDFSCCHSRKCQQALRRILPAVRGGTPWSGELTLRAGPARFRTVFATLFTLGDGRREPLSLGAVVTVAAPWKRAERRLDQRNAQLQRLLALSERERRLVACELHDTVCQDLLAAQMQIVAAEQRAVKNPAHLRQALKLALGLIRAGLSATRRLIEGLRPAVSEVGGVAAAVKRFLKQRPAEAGIRYRFQCNLSPRRLHPLVEHALFRIIGEAVANAERHSRTKTILVDLVAQRGRVRVEVHDWGVGFTPGKVPERAYGLESIRQRARLLGGQATVHSAPGQGTRISVEVPTRPAVDASLAMC